MLGRKRWRHTVCCTTPARWLATEREIESCSTAQGIPRQPSAVRRPAIQLETLDVGRGIRSLRRIDIEYVIAGQVDGNGGKERAADYKAGDPRNLRIDSHRGENVPR